MATSARYFYPEAQAARSLASGAAGSSSTSDADLQFDIANAILTAVDAGLFTCTVSVSGFAALDIQTEMGMLQGLGYTVSLSSTTLTINW
jgi:hypothetical protein